MKFDDTPYPQLSKNHLAELKKLHQKKFRHLENKTLAEGMNLIEQLRANGIYPQELITSDETQVQQMFKAYSCPVLLSKLYEIEQLAETKSPQPVIGIYEIPQYKIQDYKLALYLDGIRDPGNLGAIFRIAAAFDISAVYLSTDCCEVFAPKVIRASLGSVFWLQSETTDSDWLAKQPCDKVGLIMNGKIKLKDYTLDKNKSLLVIIGSESSGISSEVIKGLTHTIKIPISSKMESLNAAVATGIALYEISGRFSC